jgi:hypothetical protein
LLTLSVLDVIIIYSFLSWRLISRNQARKATLCGLVKLLLCGLTTLTVQYGDEYSRRETAREAQPFPDDDLTPSVRGADESVSSAATRRGKL